MLWRSPRSSPIVGSLRPICECGAYEGTSSSVMPCRAKNPAHRMNGGSKKLQREGCIFPSIARESSGKDYRASACSGHAQAKSSNMRPVDLCALCLERRELCNSHVISDFLYKAMYDEKHRFHQVTVGEDRARFQQSGLREYLLCDACEARLSAWEQYARVVLKGGIELQYSNEHGITWVSGIDYTKFRLFQLSILWRAGCAKHRFFENVVLGPHQEHIRRMLIRSDPGHPGLYPCLMKGLRLEGRVADVVIQPTKVRIANVRGYRFVFGGFLWAYAVARHSLHGAASAFAIQRNGRMGLVTGDLETAPFFRKLISRL